MKVSGVRTTADTPVTLLFVDAGVHIIDHTTGRGRLLRVAGGAVFAAFAIAALSLGIGHAVNAGFGVALATTALALAVAAGVTALVVWLLTLKAEHALRHGATAPTIAVNAVRWATSKLDRGRVEVIIGMTDDTIHTFYASGVAGPELARQFGRLLAVADASNASSSTEVAAQPDR